MAFIRPMAGGARAIVLGNPDGTSQRVLAMRAGSDTYEDTGLAWSPDGIQIATTHHDRKLRISKLAAKG